MLRLRRRLRENVTITDGASEPGAGPSSSSAPTTCSPGSSTPSSGSTAWETHCSSRSGSLRIRARKELRARTWSAVSPLLCFPSRAQRKQPPQEPGWRRWHTQPPGAPPWALATRVQRKGHAGSCGGTKAGSMAAASGGESAGVSSLPATAAVDDGSGCCRSSSSLMRSSAPLAATASADAIAGMALRGGAPFRVQMAPLAQSLLTSGHRQRGDLTSMGALR